MIFACDFALLFDVREVTINSSFNLIVPCVFRCYNYSSFVNICHLPSSRIILIRKLGNQLILFLITKYPSTCVNLAISKVTWYVDEFYPISLINAFLQISFIVPKSTHIFIFIHCKNKVTNHNEIHFYRVYKIFGNTSIITIKPIKVYNTNQNVSYLFILF